MPEPPRTLRYDGLFPSQSHDRFEADAAQAARNDWYPESQTWSGTELQVTYVHDPGRRAREAAAAAAVSTPAGRSKDLIDVSERGGSWGWGSAPGRIIAGLLVGVVVVAIAGMTMAGMGMFDHAPVPTRPPAVIVPVVNLGPRADAIAVLGSLGFTGDMDVLPDGRERWLGTSPTGAVAEAIGPEAGIAEVSLSVPPGTDAATAGTLLGFLTRFGPETRDWFGEGASLGQVHRLATTERRFGDLIAEVTDATDATDATGPRLRYAIRAATSTDDRVPRARLVAPEGRSTPARRFSDGAWQVGRDVAAGTYRASGGVGCYWARLGGLDGSIGAIIDDGLKSGSPTVTIKRSDEGFETQGCGVWSPR